MIFWKIICQKKILPVALNTGMNFSEYVNCLRPVCSRELLARKGERLTIYVITDEAGCSLCTTFYRHFREKYGLSNEEF